jgi:PD-(D/E)XK endonuclease
MKLTNRQIGAVGVARVAGVLFRNGYNVLTPMEDFSGYDLVAEKDGKFIRIQVKTSEKQDPERNRYGFMTSVGNGSKEVYNKSMVDYIICWAMDSDLFWIFKPSECKSKNKKCKAKTGSSWRIISDL